MRRGDRAGAWRVLRAAEADLAISDADGATSPALGDFSGPTGRIAFDRRPDSRLQATQESDRGHRDELLKVGAAATADDLAELGYWQWRLREADRALDTLSRAKKRDPRPTGRSSISARSIKLRVNFRRR